MAIKRALIVIIGLLLQILLFLFTYLYLADHIVLINFLYEIIGFLIVLGLIRNSKSYSYILPWIVIILLFPVVGSLLYLIIGYNKKTSRILKKIINSEKKSKQYLVQDQEIREKVKNNSGIRYITDYIHYPITTNNDIKYYKVGELAFEDMLKELKKAKKFIFLEYFIIKPGKMWNYILEILKEKVKNGVEVRIIYDDLGCIISGFVINNRDHRKILVIDGKVAFSGGINIADEYINIGSKIGHWKDNAVKVLGDAVWSYTVMFLTMWNAFKNDNENFEKYKYKFTKEIKNRGYISPYGETPLDEEIAGQNIYLNIINQANDYIYISTPYLIIDTDMMNALSLAAKRGVDVKIIIPGIPDKKIVYSLSESYAELLIKEGVKVYKYTPGFIHAKVFVSDDQKANVGTINLDYRSLYLNFECGMYMENVECIKEIKEDMIDTINKSFELTKKDIKKSPLKSIKQALLRLIAPLM